MFGSRVEGRNALVVADLFEVPGGDLARERSSHKQYQSFFFNDWVSIDLKFECVFRAGRFQVKLKGVTNIISQQRRLYIRSPPCGAS
jgi:hypothetical protein